MRTPQRVFSTVLAFIAAVCLAFSTAPVASAQTPMQLTGLVTDTTHTLSNSDVSRIEAASNELHAATNSKLYFVMVNTFEDPSNGNDWASAVAKNSQLPDSDIVLYIGLDEQEVGLNVAASLPLSSSDRISIQDDIIPLVNNSDFVGAAERASQDLTQALNGSYPGSSSNGNSGSYYSSTTFKSNDPLIAGGFFTLVLGVIVLVAFIAAAAAFMVVRQLPVHRPR